MGFRIVSSGIALPQQVVPNKELEERLHLEEGTIERLVGIRERRFCSGQDTCPSLALTSALQALDSASVDFKEIGLVLMGTNTPGAEYYAFAHELTHALSARNRADIQREIVFLPGTCTLLIHQLEYTKRFLQEHQDKAALIVTATDQSRYLDMGDKSTAILFGDASSSLVLKYSDAYCRFEHIHDCSGYKALSINAQRNIVMPSGSAVCKFIGKNIEEFVARLRGESAIDAYLFHQANGRILEFIQNKLDISSEKIFYHLKEYGNTGCCSLGLAFHDACTNGFIQRGDTVMLVGYATGFEMSGCVFTF